MAGDVRRRRTLGTNRDVCSVCGHQGLDVIESRRVRRGRAGVGAARSSGRGATSVGGAVAGVDHHPVGWPVDQGAVLLPVLRGRCVWRRRCVVAYADRFTGLVGRVALGRGRRCAGAGARGWGGAACPDPAPRGDRVRSWGGDLRATHPNWPSTWRPGVDRPADASDLRAPHPTRAGRGVGDSSSPAHRRRAGGRITGAGDRAGCSYVPAAARDREKVCVRAGLVWTARHVEQAPPRWGGAPSFGSLSRGRLAPVGQAGPELSVPSSATVTRYLVPSGEDSTSPVACTSRQRLDASPRSVVASAVGAIGWYQ